METRLITLPMNCCAMIALFATHCVRIRKRRRDEDDKLSES